jgi:uncharacterized protein with GYD domain
MPAYVTLTNYTEKGMRNVKSTVNRARAFDKAIQSVGGRKIGIWWLLGQYDSLVIFEAPDDETATRVLLKTGMQGNVHTMTMRCFSEEEMERIVQELT